MSINITGPLVPKNDAFDGIVSSQDVAKTVDGRTASAKASTVSGDKFLIFDSADSDAPKLVDHDNMPGGGGGGSGDVVGPVSATDNAVARYDTTTGKLIQDSGVLVDDTGAMYGDAVDRLLYVFENTTERDTFFTAHPNLLITDMLICIKDTSPPPTPGTRSLDYSKAINSQYHPLPL